MERNDYFILIACEESQRVTKAFHDLGFVNTFSCDIIDPSGGMLDFHIKDDIWNVLKDNGTYGYTFKTLKRTCLWLKNLPLLEKTNVVTPIFSWHDMNNGSKDRSILAPHFAKENGAAMGHVFGAK